jgi:ABC-type phosphate/phosphonate transport system substrate-binding protein
VVAARRLPQTLKADLRTILLEMGDDPAARANLARGFVQGFVPVTDSTYNDIRDMLAAAEAISFVEIR